MQNLFSTQFILAMTLLMSCWVTTLAQDNYKLDLLLKDKGFQRISIKHGKKDSIDFIVSINQGNTPKPLVLFLQGSGDVPVLSYLDGELGIHLPFNPKPYLGQCNFAIINKKGVPICSNRTRNSEVFSEEFMASDYLDNYVERSEVVLKYLKRTDWVKRDSIFVVGHSQGYRVAAKLAATSKIPCKVVCMSANPFNRFAEQIAKVTEAAGYQLDGIQDIESVYASSRMVHAYSKRFGSINKMPADARNMVSFNRILTVSHLLKTKVPLLVVHGTNDLGSRDNLLLPILFDAHQNPNLSLKTKIGYDHNFWKNNQTEYGWDEVFQEVFDWLVLPQN